MFILMRRFFGVSMDWIGTNTTVMKYTIKALIMEQVKPVTPADCKKEKILHPTLVLIVNEILLKKYDEEPLIIHRKEIVDKFLDLEFSNGWTKDKIDEEKILFIAKYYSAAGWKVKYNSPSFGDSDFEPYYIFSS
jgi:hypothetical protein